MKLYVCIFAIVAMTHVVSADWKEELLSERMTRLADFVTKQTDVLTSAAIIHQNGFHCISSAVSQFGIALTQAQTQLKQCVNKTDDEDEAKKCCYVQESTAISKISQVTTSALSCIYSS